MAEHYALVRDGVVDNVIVADETFAASYAQSRDEQAFRVDNLDPQPGIGWTYTGTSFVAPVVPTLVANPSSIPPDGTTTSTVTYTDESENAPTTVTFSVNGTHTDKTLTNGVATVLVASSTPHDTVTVTANGLTTTIAVTA